MGRRLLTGVGAGHVAANLQSPKKSKMGFLLHLSFLNGHV